MIQKLWLYPPFAIARLGTSPIPCPGYTWGPNDLRPRGTGKTTIVATQTLHLDENGGLTSEVPKDLRFKDKDGFRPVCPFFELHGEWRTEDDTVHSGPITREVLALFGKLPRDLKWMVEVANLKPYHYTLNNEDRISARLEITGNLTTPQRLEGTSQPDPSRSSQEQQPLVPANRHIPFGSIQLTRSTNNFPTFRLRFTPAFGHVYAPTNLPQRNSPYSIPGERLILNPNATWSRFTLSDDDPRTNPGGLYAMDKNQMSLGLCDDICDGIIRCTLKDGPEAFARITVGPPDYAPDRRPFTSLADGLADRVKRQEVRDPSYVSDKKLTTLEIGDLFERIVETLGLMNLDFQNIRARRENRNIAQEQGLPTSIAENKAFPRMEPVLGRPMPLTEYGNQRHRRFVSVEVIEDILRERKDLIEKWIREPMTGDRYYDRRMPPLMRGSDRYPMHLTRRQYDLLVAWIQHLRKDKEEGT